MRRATVFAALIVALAAVAWFTYTALEPSGSSAAPPAANGLACSVKPADPGCVGDEVEVFRISATSNAHAAAAGDPTYTNLVCCGGVTNPGTSCSETYDTVLRLSAAANAHVQATGSYPTEVCLSAGTAVVQCMFASSCTAGYACLVTASATDNAHVADCDGTNDYATKVCCYAGDPIPVGGIAAIPDVDGSDPAARNYVALVGLAAALLVALTAGGWYARRRWLA